jgi:hypothetical protein
MSLLTKSEIKRIFRKHNLKIRKTAYNQINSLAERYLDRIATESKDILYKRNNIATFWIVNETLLKQAESRDDNYRSMIFSIKMLDKAQEEIEKLKRQVREYADSKRDNPE